MFHFGTYHCHPELPYILESLHTCWDLLLHATALVV